MKSNVLNIYYQGPLRSTPVKKRTRKRTESKRSSCKVGLIVSADPIGHPELKSPVRIVLHWAVRDLIRKGMLLGMAAVCCGDKGRQQRACLIAIPEAGYGQCTIISMFLLSSQVLLTSSLYLKP